MKEENLGKISLKRKVLEPCVCHLTGWRTASMCIGARSPSLWAPIKESHIVKTGQSDCFRWGLTQNFNKS